MSDFELFKGFDAAEGMDEQSFERFKEQMKRNAAQMAGDQKQEQRQKEKEEKLAAILSKFMKKNKKMHLILLISRCLEENIPAPFLLSVVLLGNEEIQEEAGVKLALPEADMKRLEEEVKGGNRDMREISQSSREIIRFDGQASVLPLGVRIAIDLWGRAIFETASINPHKILGRAYEIQEIAEDRGQSKEKTKTFRKDFKNILLRLTATVIEDYMNSEKISGDFSVYEELGHFLLKGIMKRLEDQIEEQKLLK